MGFLITEMILFLAGAALLGLIIGWALFGGKKEGAPAAAGASTAAVKKAEARVKELEAEREGLSSNLSERDAAIAELAQQLRLAEQNRVEAASKIEQLKSQLGAAQASGGGGGASDAEVARLKRELEEARAASAASAASATPESALVSELKAQVAELRATLESGGQLATPPGGDDEKDATIARLQEENLGLKANYDAAERSLEEQDGAIDQLTHELLKAQQRIAQLESVRVGVGGASAVPAPPEPPPLTAAAAPKKAAPKPVVEEATVAMAVFELPEEAPPAKMPPLPPELPKAPPKKELAAEEDEATRAMPVFDLVDEDDEDEGDQTMVVSKEQLLAKLKPAAGSGGAEGADGEPDDLKQIRGIGPAIEKRLHEQGIVTVAQIASLDDDACEGLAAAIKVSADKIRRDQWVEQARSLQAGS
ncbi:MAG: hypothetical protein KC635_27480 [Myxococcales bacterium]|nr:hypothetical protein [Myxococcales bacterium]MCB9734291.1 hypothetical protein [Deltaproteobacteria bacterium]